jgi:hypothetical protein
MQGNRTPNEQPMPVAPAEFNVPIFRLTRRNFL